MYTECCCGEEEGESEGVVVVAIVSSDNCIEVGADPALDIVRRLVGCRRAVVMDGAAIRCHGCELSHADLPTGIRDRIDIGTREADSLANVILATCARATETELKQWMDDDGDDDGIHIQVVQTQSRNGSLSFHLRLLPM